MECWAHELGDCRGGQSGEHHVSASLFPTTKVLLVKGFPWCMDEHKTVGLPSLTANILCRHHNSALSPFDEAARGAPRRCDESSPST